MNIRDKYIEFFVSKGHKQIPSAPVVPENDPSVLFNTAGMQPLVPYLMGESHPYGTRLCDYQKCIRTNDLDEVGDVTHHTFFEMLGNWSLGDYFKKESITWSFELLTKHLNIPVEKLSVTVFKGNDIVPADNESADLWKSLGISENKIAFLGEDDNWWPNMELTGPCGPDTEIFYWRSDEEVPSKFDPENDNWVEIWNNVFMQYNHKPDGTFEPLKKKNVDTGMGLERITAVLEGVNDNYESSIWKGTIKKIEEISGKSYYGNEKAFRIIADHIKAAVFISSDPAGIKPSNTDQGYILRRLIRRAIRYAKMIDIDINSNWESEIAKNIIDEYKKYYSELSTNENVVMEVLKNEKIKLYVVEVKNTPKGAQIIVSRTHPGLVKRLFELEVPEIYEGVVEIKSISREAGSRSKIAVVSHDENVDPMGACVGPKGARVQNIVDELKGEKIDIIKWSKDPAEFLASALSPAKVLSVTVDEETKSAKVIVDDNQLSLAIGKEGQNVRLAAKLTNWKIDIKSKSQAEALEN